MLIIQRIISKTECPRWDGYIIERVLINSSDACKHRLVCRTDTGRDILITLERGSYLAHNTILFKGESRIIIVEREPEEAALVQLSNKLPVTKLIAQAVQLAHAFGNQHVPLEINRQELRIPVLTSRDVVSRTIVKLDLSDSDIAVRFCKVRLGMDAPLLGSGMSHK